jgi:hypothetical protein
MARHPDSILTDGLATDIEAECAKTWTECWVLKDESRVVLTIAACVSPESDKIYYMPLFTFGTVRRARCRKAGLAWARYRQQYGVRES